MAKHNWEALRAEYVEGIAEDNGRLRWPALEEVATRHAVNAIVVRKRSADDGWVEQRTLFRRRVEAQRQEARSAQLAEMGADLDLNGLRLARSGMAIIAARLSELGALATRRAAAVQEQERNRTVAQLPPPPHYEEVARLARAATEWYDLGAKALGDTPLLGVTLGTAPGAPLVFAVEDDETRDRRTEGIITILARAGVFTPDGSPDARGTRLALAAGGNGAPYPGSPNGAEDDAVHSGDVGDEGE